MHLAPSSNSLSTGEGGGRIFSGDCSSTVPNYPSSLALLQPGFSSGKEFFQGVYLYLKRQKMVKYIWQKVCFPRLVGPLERSPVHRCCGFKPALFQTKIKKEYCKCNSVADSPKLCTESHGHHAHTKDLMSTRSRYCKLTQVTGQQGN